MPEKMFIPSIEKRLAHFMELTQKAKKESAEKEKKKLTITLSREFGCEGYPVAEKLKEILDSRTKEQWVIMDKALIDEVAKDHHLLDSCLSTLGEKSRVLEEAISTFSPAWKTERDYYRLLCRQLFALATGGNVIIVGRGASIVTQSLENCFHFRLYASNWFKVQYLSKKISLSVPELEKFIAKKQKQRDKFVCDFLNCDAGELHYYNLVINNDKNPSEKIAKIIADYVISS